MSKKNKFYTASAAFLLGMSALAGCSPKAAEEDAEKEMEAAENTEIPSSESDETMITYTSKANADTTSIINGSLEYVPFSAADPSQIGTEIGTVQFTEEDPVENIYEVIGQPSDQWIIAAADDQKDPMIYREISVTEYPEGFVSEYPWN